MSIWYDKDHPIWKIIQSIVALTGLIFWITHVGIGAHDGLSPDISDTTGVVGLGLGSKLVYDLLKNLNG